MSSFQRDVRDLITRKRHGGYLESHEIAELVATFSAGEVRAEQMAALLMAGVIQGFSDEEAVAFTVALVASGTTVDLTGLTGPTVDKHSTGGVGDTTSLVVGPLVAACGAQMAKLSGRALGHTGGTLDKLEAIPGFRVELDEREFRAQVERVGLVIAAATDELVPADKILYALRDRTATVDSPALIAASVMSKKIAGGARHIVLDIKTGRGALVPELSQSLGLAELCVRVGQAPGVHGHRRVTALVTDMSQPLGTAVGNALEVASAVAVLKGDVRGRLGRLSIELATALLTSTGVSESSARAAVEEARSRGTALEKLGVMVEAQGGDGRFVDDPWRVLPRAPIVREWLPREGVVAEIACRGIGELAHTLGAGRQQAGGAIDPAVGLEVLVAVGDEVGPDRPAVRIHARTESDAEGAAKALQRLVTIGRHPIAPPPLILGRILP